MDRVTRKRFVSLIGVLPKLANTLFELRPLLGIRQLVLAERYPHRSDLVLENYRVVIVLGCRERCPAAVRLTNGRDMRDSLRLDPASCLPKRFTFAEQCLSDRRILRNTDTYSTKATTTKIQVGNVWPKIE